MANRKVANWEHAVSLFPSVKNETNEMWLELFNRSPQDDPKARHGLDVMGKILRDLYDATKRDEVKADRRDYGGRRTKTTDGSLDELYRMISPRFSMDPFPVAVTELMSGRSLRQFAGRVPMDHRQLSRLMRGGATLTMFELEQIAKAGRVGPAYFVEWRTMYVTSAVAQAFAAHPNMSIQACKSLFAVVDR